MRTLFLVNPKAHKVAKRGSALLAAADTLGVPCTLVDESYAPVAGADRVFIEGGDGTVSDVVGRWLGSGLELPEFAILPGGTTNQIAGVLGLRADTTRSLHAAIHSELRKTPTPLLEIARGEGEPARHGFLFSTGALPRVTERIQRYRGRVGMSGVGLVGRAIFDALRPRSDLLGTTDARVEADLDHEQLVMRGEHFGLFATTLRTLYLGLDPFWGEGSGGVRVTYGGENARAFVPTLAGQWLGRKDPKVLRERGFESFNTDHLRVVTQGPVTLDGDPLEGDAFTVRPSRPVTFLR